MSVEHFNFGTALTKGGAPTDGVFQVETATVVGTITTAGNANVVVTAAGMTGSPITVPVAVAEDDDAAAIAAKFRAALQANAVIAAFFTVGGTGADVVLTRTSSAADDATMNIAYADDTSAGITEDATSTHTTAGVKGDYHGVGSGQVLIDTTNRTVYQNSGNHHRPVWTAQ